MSAANEPQPTPETPVPVEETVIVTETEVAIDQLRALVCGLVVGLLLTSVAFTLYIFKETRTLKYQIGSRQAQIKQTEEFLKAVEPAVQDLAKFSVGKPDLTAVFARYGMKIGSSAAPASTSAPGFQPMP